MSGLCLEARSRSSSSALSPHFIRALSTQRFALARSCVSEKQRGPACRDRLTSPRTTREVVCVASPLTSRTPGFGGFEQDRSGLGQTWAQHQVSGWVGFSADWAFRAVVPSVSLRAWDKNRFPGSPSTYCDRIIKTASVGGARSEMLTPLTVVQRHFTRRTSETQRRRSFIWSPGS